MNSANKIKEQICSKRSGLLQKFSQRGIANKLGISESHLSNILSGRRTAKPELMTKIQKIINSDIYKISKN